MNCYLDSQTGQWIHLDPHTEVKPSGTVVFTCGLCGIRLVD